MILILGGTAEAHGLAMTLEGKFIVSLAGATRNPSKRDYPTRIGGFGGADGLAGYIACNNITAIIDATHPFAAQISHNADAAAQQTQTPLLRLSRPMWDSTGWRNFASVAEAADAIPSHARVFLTVGRKASVAFQHRSDVWFLTRSIDPAVLLNGVALLQRPPFTMDAEVALMRQHNITHLVTKNAGGPQTRAKIDAATYLKLPIIAIDRPHLPLAETVETIEDALQWIRRQGGQRGSENDDDYHRMRHL